MVQDVHSVHQIVCNGGRLGIKNMCSGSIPTQIIDFIIVVRYVSENAKAPPRYKLFGEQ